jgi:hypothetical protein
MHHVTHRIVVASLAALAVCVAPLAAPAAGAKRTKVHLVLYGKLGANGASGPVKGAPCVKGKFVSKLLPPKINYTFTCRGATFKLQATVSLHGSDVTGTWKTVSGTKRYAHMHGKGSLNGSLVPGKTFVLTGSVTGV